MFIRLELILSIRQYRNIFYHMHFFFHNIEYETAVMASPGFYFEKKMHTELLWQQLQTRLIEVTTG